MKNPVKFINSINRLIRNKFEPEGVKLLVKRSSAGLGLFAGEDISKGISIIEYKGRVITGDEIYDSKSKYLFEVTKNITIDGAARSNTARYINHSCKPNAEIEISKKRVFVLTKRKIKEGEEITYDYGKEYWKEHIQPKGCRCDKCQNKAK